MRGRLIKRFLVGIARLDPATTRSSGGYNERLRAVKAQRPQGARGLRKTGRRELAEVRIPCQVEILAVSAQRQGPGGDVREYRTTFVLHFKDLERLGLVDSTTGKPLVQVNDRITAIYTKGGTLERLFDDPEVFVMEARGQAYGLGSRRNLLLLISTDRQQGLQTV